MSSKSFTLIELLVVMAIIGLLASIAIVNVNSAREKAKVAKTVSFSQQIYQGLGAEAVGYWPFNGNANDLSSNGNGGTLVGSPTYVQGLTFSGGSFGQALNSVSGYVNLGNPSSLRIADTFTIEGWIYSFGDSGTIQAWFGNGYTQAGSIFIGGHSSYPSSWWIMLPGPSEWVFGKKEFNKWSHIVITFNLGLASKQLKAYQDGVLVSEKDWISDVMTRSSARSIGYGSVGNRWNGLVDEVRIYSTALSSAEIQQHYAEGLPKHQLAKQ